MSSDQHDSPTLYGFIARGLLGFFTVLAIMIFVELYPLYERAKAVVDRD